MYGRYGNDELGRFMLIAAMICCIASLFLKNGFGAVLYYASIFLIIFVYIRMFSRNIQKRYQENIRFINKKNAIKKKYNTEKSIFSQRRYYHFYRCPRCRQRIRIPRGKGRIEIRCPKCNERFIKNS